MPLGSWNEGLSPGDIVLDEDATFSDGKASSSSPDFLIIFIHWSDKISSK